MPKSLRKKTELEGLSRAPSQSHWRTQIDILESEKIPEKGRFRAITDYLKTALFGWLIHYIKSRFGPKEKFREYDKEDSGIYPLSNSSTPGQDNVIVSLIADWATRTKESSDIAELVKKGEPDFTIHLGDTYYVGTPLETRENYFAVVQWPLGKSGSFALNGNHEMYARGTGYFKFLLPFLGMYDTDAIRFIGQKASYFCLENKYWRIFGIDTGYNSVGFPLVEKISFFRPNCELPNSLMDWLTKTAKIKDQTDRRGIIILSHHQYYSAFEKGFSKPAEQLAKLIGVDKSILWFWGHEHRLALYGKCSVKQGVMAYGRCIGHGGMPIEIGEKPNAKDVEKYKLAVYDDRADPDSKNNSLGFNGFANLRFSAEKLIVEYRDIDGRMLIQENWEIDLTTGKLIGVGIELLDDRLTNVKNDLSIAIK